MARKRKKKDKKDASASSFTNNPLAGEIKSIKRTLKKRKEARFDPPKISASEKKDSSDEVLDDGEVFRRAVGGTQAVRARGREVTHTGNADIPTRVRREDVDSNDFLSDEDFDIRFSEQFIRGRATGVSRETFDRLETGHFSVRSHVDLHGMALDDAKQTVDEFLADCQLRGERCVLVITGKGRNSPGQIGVLRQGIPEWLSRGPSTRRVLAFVTARPCDGGEGALYVLLRIRAGRKTRIEVESGGGA